MTIVGNQKDGVNVYDTVFSQSGGARLVPRLLTDGGYALSDNAKTDPTTAAVHPILAGWTDNNTPTYAPITLTRQSQSWLMLKCGDKVYTHRGGQGNGALTMPADNVFRFAAGPKTGADSELNRDARRTQISANNGGTDPIGGKTGETVWAAYSYNLGDTPGIVEGTADPRYNRGFQFLQWAETKGFSHGNAGPPLSVISRNEELVVMSASSAELDANTNFPVYKDRYKAPLPAKGVVENWVHQITWGPTGHINMWRNGQQILNLDCPIGFWAGLPATATLGFFEIGHYGSATQYTDVSYAANIEWSFSSLADRITAPLPVPDVEW
jgi:hypothetical protein